MPTKAHVMLFDVRRHSSHGSDWRRHPQQAGMVSCKCSTRILISTAYKGERYASDCCSSGIEFGS
ncbi:hypothetical protein CY34DRAFT_812818 [Suillus luteus UH-Slu-Lm8-n1]|uniref:Uncharacterized protein n=1 Tax=Suillus luteus UH-Slu-Lm8-n1 TaxID=930992 RepID=A0A0C9ZAN4_9AGAM|nr:hypothetical protein CY34DRAFT_812818 [Suillus luteus UH-Slu-Lm8-n1]